MRVHVSMRVCSSVRGLCVTLCLFTLFKTFQEYILTLVLALLLLALHAFFVCSSSSSSV